MKAIKIGIITCSNATQDMDCCSVSCFKDFNKRLGSFQAYPADTALQLAGIITCAGCPTRAYPEKILRRVDSLAQFGVQYLHFANCMGAFCPFLAKYFQAIQERYPEIQLVKGTHEPHISGDVFREKLACAFETGMRMPDIIRGKV